MSPRLSTKSELARACVQRALSQYGKDIFNRVNNFIAEGDEMLAREAYGYNSYDEWIRLPHKQRMEMKQAWLKAGKPRKMVSPITTESATWKDKANLIHEMVKKEYEMITSCKVPYPFGNITVGHTTSQPYWTTANLAVNIPNQEETDMSYTQISPEKNYLIQRARDVKYDHEAKLPKAFGLRDDDAPTTKQDLEQRLKDGKFVIDADDKGNLLDAWNYSLRWRDPSMEEDRDGHLKAYEQIQKDHFETKDLIMVSEPKDGLEALKAFQSKTYH